MITFVFITVMITCIHHFDDYLYCNKINPRTYVLFLVCAVILYSTVLSIKFNGLK